MVLFSVHIVCYAIQAKLKHHTQIQRKSKTFVDYADTTIEILNYLQLSINLETWGCSLRQVVTIFRPPPSSGTRVHRGMEGVDKT